MRRLIRSVGLSGLALVLAVALARCTDASPPVSPGESAPAEVRLSAERAQSAVDNSALPHGRRNVHWLAEVHTAAMQEATANRRQWKALGLTARCARIEGVVRRFVPDIAANTGVRDPAFYEAAIAAARRDIGCGPRPSLSIWGVPRAAFSYSASDAIVSGEYMNHTGALNAAMAIQGTPGQIAAALDQVLVQASGINQPDYEVLAGLASLGASSAYYWYEYERAGGFDGGGGGSGDQPAEMAIFRWGECRFWCKVGVADLVGSMAGAAGVFYAGGAVVPAAVLAGAAIGGIAGSVTAMM